MLAHVVDHLAIVVETTSTRLQASELVSAERPKHEIYRER
jgi:hypothetical protein